MAIDSNNNEAGAIPANLPYKAMRLSMENKNLLKSKGSIYVGVGSEKSATITYDEVDSSGTPTGKTITTPYTVPVTEALDPPSNDGKTYVLTCTNGTLSWQLKN